MTNLNVPVTTTTTTTPAPENKLEPKLSDWIYEVKFRNNDYFAIVADRGKMYYVSVAMHSSREKKRILLLIREGDVLRTVFKNNSHRTIFLELKVEGDRGLIARCEYRDSRSAVMVFGLKTIYFDFSLPALLEIVNTELEGGFTDIAVTEEHTLILDRPICGRI